MHPPTPPKPAPAIPGYTLLERLGAGAAGVVWRAHRLPDNQLVAIKLLRHSLLEHPVMLERLRREATAAMSVEHPHIVRVLDVSLDWPQPYIVMEYLPGRSLEELVLARGPMKPEDAVHITLQILDALAHLHQRGLLHRDVKADNVLVDARSHAVLTDLGLVLDVRGSDQPRITAEGVPLGTPGYMPPEQWTGAHLDARADLFSAGVLLYYMLCARLPWQGDTPIATFQRLSSREHDPISKLQRGDKVLHDILHRALARDREERFASATAFIDALQRWRAPSPDPSPKATTTMTQTPLPSPIAAAVAAAPDHDARKLAALPFEFAPGCWWVGKRPPGEIFYANPYLRTSEGDGKRFHLLIDPGSSRDVSIVQAKCAHVLRNDLDSIGGIFINHQDPDVGSAVGVLLGKTLPNAHVMCSEDTWRLIQYYNIPRERFIALERFPNGFDLPTGLTLVPVPSPFCHFVGAIMLYDPANRVLFTGDLFGGLTAKGAQGLWADESDWVGMRAFHQIYMPTNKALRVAIRAIRAIKGGVDIIAPQHGRLIRGELVGLFMDRLEQLQVGLDILSDRQATPEELRAWNTVLDRIIHVASSLTDLDLVAYIADDAHLRGVVARQGDTLELRSLGKFAVERALRLIAEALHDNDLMAAVKYEAIFATEELGLPTPVMELDEDGGSSASGSMLGMV
jgi:eukaryotic-like serine/threonine-protein kinase